MPTEYEFYTALEKRHGTELQRKIRKSCVAVCGLGGLGSNIAVLLARMGIGKLLLFDFDSVDLSNIGRQHYFLSQIGMLKTDAITEIISGINPYCSVVTANIRLDSNNIPTVLKDADIVCEAFDNPESKAVLVDTVCEKFPGKYLVTASGMSGIHTANIITTRQVTKKFFVCGDGESTIEKDGTLFASRVAVCASHQANAIIQIIGEEDFDEQ